MAPPVLDFDTLLAPIEGDNPAGMDLRTDTSPSSAYYAIKDARNAARTAERQISKGEEGVSPPDWAPVVRRGSEVLAGKTKDLEVVAYMIEALVRLEGFPGLRDGFRLARELMERFWDGLYPLPDEEGLPTRLAPLVGLNGEDEEGTLIAPINNVPLTDGEEPGPFAYHHYQQASALAQVADEEARNKRIARGATTLEMYAKSVAATRPAFFGALLEDIGQAQQEFAQLAAVLDDKCGSNAPPTSYIRNALATCLETLKNTAKDRIPVASADGEAAPEEGEATAEGRAAPAAGAARGDGALRTREDALRTLIKVAEFFRSTEPHTPVSYALEQAVRWGRMSLPDLLTELIPDESARAQLFKQVGIKPPEQMQG
jgi:type VI secretion system protein ImpA